MEIPWANVLVILALGAIFIAVSWYISKRVATADAYISGHGTLGIAFGTTAVLAFWVTGNTIMAAPEAAYNFGVIGAIGYSFLGGMAVIAFAPLGKRIHQVIPNGRTVGDFYRHRYSRPNYIFFLIMVFAYVFGLLMTQGIGGGLLLEQIFEVPYYLAVILTFLIVIVYSTMGGFSSVTGIAFFQVIVILAVVIVVPPVVFFQTGISPIYEGMLDLAPEKLDLLLPAGIFFMFAGAMFGVGEVFMDNTFWQRAYAVKKDKLLQIFTLAGVGWFVVPLATATLAFVAIGTGRVPDQVNQVAPYIAQIYGGGLASWVFLVGVWSALASTIAAILNSLASLFVNDVYMPRRPGLTDKHYLNAARVTTVVIGLIALVLSLPQFLTMLEMLIFLGVINAAFVFPIAFGLFWDKIGSTGALAGPLVAIVTGYITYFTVGGLNGVVVSGWTSFLICFSLAHIRPAHFDWDILRRVGDSTLEVQK